MSYNESLGSRGAEEARNDHGEIFMGPFFFPTKIQEVRREMQSKKKKKKICLVTLCYRTHGHSDQQLSGYSSNM